MRNPSFNRDQDPNDLSFGTKTCVDVVDLANTPKGHTPLLAIFRKGKSTT